MKTKIVLLLFISIFFLGCQNKDISTEITPVEVEESVQSQDVLETLEESADNLAAARDQKRTADIAAIKNALELYNVENGSYPNTLEDLGIILPTNPTPGGKDYSYTPIGSLPAQFYDLCFELEEDRPKCVNP